MSIDAPINDQWIKKISRALVDLDSIPLIKAPPFDWEQFSRLLGTTFEIEDLLISPKEIKWRSGEELKDGLGENIVPLSFTLEPLEGNAFWLMSEEDIARLTSYFLTKDPASKGFSSSILQEGFYRYLLLESLSSLEELSLFQGLTPQMAEAEIPNETGFLTIDVQIQVMQKTTWGRLVLTPSFRNAWNSQAKAQFSRPEALTSNIELMIKLNLGSVSLSYDEMKSLSPGDFVLLEQVKYDSETHKGQGVLRLEETPLFHVKIKQNRIKILDYASYYKEDEMTENTNQKAKEESFEENPLEEDFEREEEESENEEISPRSEPSVSLEEMPISLTIEVCRFKISLEKLMQLQPGNFLELPVTPEQGVDLTVNGKKIGKAELVQLGEALGLRILNLGK